MRAWLALALAFVAGCGGEAFTIAPLGVGADAGAIDSSKIDAHTTDSAGDATYERTYNPEPTPEAAPPERDALAPDVSPGLDAPPDVRAEASAPDAGPDSAPPGDGCKVHADCAGRCAPTDLKPVCDDPAGTGKGSCWCSGCTAGAAEPKCVAHCDATGRTADAGARPYCQASAQHRLPDGTTYTATVCMCGI